MTKNTIKEKEDKMTDDKAWIFVIDTDKYAGNFEREMCAFMTGIIGECGIGVEEAQLYYEQTGLSPSVAIFFEQKPSEEMCHRMMERAKSYMEYCRKMPNKYERHDITIGGFRLLEETIRQVEIGSWTV